MSSHPVNLIPTPSGQQHQLQQQTDINQAPSFNHVSNSNQQTLPPGGGVKVSKQFLNAGVMVLSLVDGGDNPVKISPRAADVFTKLAQVALEGDLAEGPTPHPMKDGTGGAGIANGRSGKGPSSGSLSTSNEFAPTSEVESHISFGNSLTHGSASLQAHHGNVNSSASHAANGQSNFDGPASLQAHHSNVNSSASHAANTHNATTSVAGIKKELPPGGKHSASSIMALAPTSGAFGASPGHSGPLYSQFSATTGAAVSDDYEDSEFDELQTPPG